MAIVPTVNYFSRDFLSLRADLINWAKLYHPDKLAYFNDANPDVMYLEMCAYVGDMLGFYIDKLFNENFRTTAQARESLVRIANDLGFFNLGATPSVVPIVLSCKVPPVVYSGTVMPDPTLLMAIKPGMQIKSDSGIYFEVLDEIDFASFINRRDIPNYDGNGAIIDYTIEKTVEAKAGKTMYQKYYVSDLQAKPFLTVTLKDLEITEVMSVLNVSGDIQVGPPDEDYSDPNKMWSEVHDLIQQTKFVELNPLQVNTQNLATYVPPTVKQGVMSLIPRRFIARRNKDDLVTLTFGGSVPNVTSSNYVPLSNMPSYNFILNDIPLGEVPAPNSTLFIKYRTGGGTKTNIQVGLINQILVKSYFPPPTGVDFNKLQVVRNSLTVRNDYPALGGKEVLSVEGIRQTAGKVFAAQDRGVTYQDVQALIESMPSKYGRPFRISYEEIFPRVANMAQVEGGVNSMIQDLLIETTQAGRQAQAQKISTFLYDLSNAPVQINPTTLVLSAESTDLLGASPTLWIGEKCRLYIVGRDENQQLVTAYKNSNGLWVSPNDTLKQNIKNYLIEKRVIGDWVDVVDARVVNLQIEYTILADPNNKQQVLLQTLNSLRSYFSTDNWYINQPIFIDNVRAILQEINGVINVVDLKINNIFGLGLGSIDPQSGKTYAPFETGRYRNNLPTPLTSTNNIYSMNTVANTIMGYPDTIFEVRYPEHDIIGKCL